MRKKHVDSLLQDGLLNGKRPAVMESAALSITAPSSPGNRRFPAITTLEGGESMAAKPNKIGIVQVMQVDEGVWHLRYRDPETGKDIRRRLKDVPEKEVQRIAAHISQEALISRGYLPGRTSRVPSIEKGFEETLRLARMRPLVRKAVAAQAAQFVEWLARRYPAVKRWDQMRPAMVQAYTRELEDAGKAFDTIRLRVGPIIQAWRHMAVNFRKEVEPAPRINLGERPRKNIQCLTPEEVSALLQWLKENASEGRTTDLYAMGCLQGLCGLRMLEAVALRVQDVDFQKGTVEVTDTGRHKPKTRDSFRTVPVCREALEALRNAVQQQKVRPTTGEIFTNAKGVPPSRERISRYWGDTLKVAAIALGNPRIKTIYPRRLRAAFTTMASRLGVADRLLKAYLGHTSGDMLGDHYRLVDLTDLREVSDRMEEWRRLVKKESWRNPVDDATPNVACN